MYLTVRLNNAWRGYDGWNTSCSSIILEMKGHAEHVAFYNGLKHTELTANCEGCVSSIEFTYDRSFYKNTMMQMSILKQI